MVVLASKTTGFVLDISLDALLSCHFFLVLTLITSFEVKGKGIPYSITSTGPELFPVFAGSHPAGDVVINPLVGCQYFAPGPRLFSQPENVTDP